MKNLWCVLRLFAWMSLLIGIIYPLVVTGLAYLGMKEKAHGSLLIIDGKARGSSLIAQKFTSEKYFWPRPSAIDYQPLPSGGSNLGPTSKELRRIVQERKKAFIIDEKGPQAIPSELLFASGSGLDPHISPEAAYFQIDRIVKARGLEYQKVRGIVDEMIQTRSLMIFGHPCLSVLQLNKALDAAIPAKKINEPQNGAKEYSPGGGSPGRGDAPLGKKELAEIAALDDL
jgi:K+-transporting ATPase ATPase C chain